LIRFSHIINHKEISSYSIVISNATIDEISFSFSHLAMQQVQNAAVLLARRYNCTASLHTAARISMIANEKQSGMAYAHKLLQQFLLKWEWSQAHTYLKEQNAFQVRFLQSLKVLIDLI
jgi:hypothetical protein